MACALGHGRLGRRLIPGEGRLGRGFERGGLACGVAEPRCVGLLGGLVRRLEDGVALLGEAGPRSRDLREAGRRLGLFRLRVRQGFLRRVAPLRDHGGDRAPEKTLEEPDQDEDVDGLEAERPPVDRHEESSGTII
jgi:hypothetical protein